MRWLLQKDLLILARSRLLVGVLVVYPIAIALLIGLAISRSPGKPKVAIVDETPPGQTIARWAANTSPVSQYADQLFSQVQPVHVPSREQAVADIKSGKVLAAVVIPRDIAARISSGVTQGSIEVLYNGNALEQSLVQSPAELRPGAGEPRVLRTDPARRRAGDRRAAHRREPRRARGAVEHDRPRADPARRCARSSRASPPAPNARSWNGSTGSPNSPTRTWGCRKNVLSTIGQPIQVKSTLVQGRRTPLNTFAVVVAVSVSLMFVCVLLAAGGVALEREEHTLARLARGLASREGLLAEKLMLAAACAFVLALAMLAGIGAFVSLDWGRAGQWLIALAFGAVAFGALGIAIGALAREVRAASLLAFLLSLPLAFLALVPAGVGVARAVRRDRRDLVRVPVQGRPAGARCGRQRRRRRVGHLGRCTCSG